jgi:hypothetical protein
MGTREVPNVITKILPLTVDRPSPARTLLAPTDRRSRFWVQLPPLCTGLDQLGQFRQAFEDELIPQLAVRPGIWALGADFAAPG